jgi:hypothetical protein
MTRDRTREVKRPSDRPDRFGQDAAGADAGAHSRRAFALAGATTLAKAGYVGEDVENSFPTCCSRPTTISNQRGIVYIDEINKISRKSDNASIPQRPDVFGAESL